MSSVLHEWQTLAHRYRLCRSGAWPEEGWIVLSPSDGRWALQDRLRCPDGRRMLFSAVLGSARGILSANLADHGVLLREVEQRRLVVLDRPIAPFVFGSAPAIRTPETGLKFEPRKERAWVDVTVVDDSVPPRPMTGVRFRLSLPDHSTHAGVLDGEGHLRVDDIEPGKCSLELSDLKRGFNR